MTDLTKWKLFIENGRQIWKYFPNSQFIQTFFEKYLLGLDISNELPNSSPTNKPRESFKKALKFFTLLQTDDGHWANDYGGPLFLLPGLIITCYISGVEIPKEHKIEIIRYLKNHQNKDGGWGLHIESHSTIFGTTMNYILLRIIGVDKDEEITKKAREFLLRNGGAKGIPSWGKFWLAALGIYGWEGLNPLLPEMWLLPYWLILHPGRFWCHCRMVYLPMCYIYGRKATAKEDDLINSLKKEIYNESYETINWPLQKWNCSKLDMYYPPSLFLKFVFGILSIFENFHNRWLRKKALDEVIDHIHFEDESTKFIDIGPVNKAINMLCVYYADGPTSERFKKHVDRIYDYLWLSSDGMKMQGYNGCQLWDTAFALQAIIESGMGNEFKIFLQKGHHYLDITQVREDVPNLKKYYRHISKGAWPFSTKDHGWPISDCTSEGLKAALLLRQFDFITPFEEERYFEAVNVILSLQNRDGGWATYENKRGPNLLEYLNPSEVFLDIIVDYSYVECTSACIQALYMFQKHYPNHRTKEINKAIERGRKFIKKIQRPDGSWIGSWGVCFTYGTWFGVEGLISTGEPQNSPCIKKACQFIVSKQREDGGWGEDFKSCVERNWVENDITQTVNTAWALMILLKASWDKEIIDRGIQYLMKAQKLNGDWELQSISGVFNANCAISYNSYKNIFPIWALSRYIKLYS
jgi:lanosterol synthase